MAGRKPRPTRDEQAGVTPLRGVPAAGSRVRRKADPDPRSGIDPETRQWSPALGRQRPAFTDGHKVNEKHGMDPAQVVARDLIMPYVRAVLDDPKMPDHLRSALAAPSLEAWARFQYLADRAFAKIAVRDFEEMAEPLGRSGQGKSLLELWKVLEDAAARRRGELGMTPASYARLRASLGLAHQAEAEALRSLATRGAEITSRRAAIEAPGQPSAASAVPDDREHAALIGGALVQQARQQPPG